METAPYINIHTHHAGDDALALRSYMAGRDTGYPPAPFSAAIHPWTLPELDVEQICMLLRELETMPAAAIGETGLDYARNINRRLQEDVFEAHLGIALRRGVPVILHCVRAYGYILHILRKYDLPCVIFHGFTGTAGLARQLLDKGYYLSYGGGLLHNTRLADALRATPADRLFLETDDEMVSVKSVYGVASEITGVPVGELREKIYANFKTCFG